MVSAKLCAGILLLIWTGVQEASAQRLVGDLPVVPVEEISQGMVAFANFASVPGPNSSNLEVRPAGEPRFDLSRANLGFQTDVTLPRIKTNGFSGPPYVAGMLDRPTAGFYESRVTRGKLRWQTLNSSERRPGYDLPPTNDHEAMVAAAKEMSHRYLRDRLPVQQRATA